MMTHQQASELLAVFALDAVDSDEQELIEAHLAECPRCRAELDAHRDVAAALGNSVGQLPEGLWSSIASRLPPRPAEEPPPMPTLVREGSAHEERTATRFHTPRTAPRRTSRGRLLSVASLAVAALKVPGHKVVDVESARHVELAQFVLVPSGQGYLVTSKLPTLSSAKTYQLWGVINGRAISLGLLGQDPHGAAFTLGGSSHPSKLGITVEPAGGSVVPTGSMLAAGTV